MKDAEEIIDDLIAGKTPKPGPRYVQNNILNEQFIINEY